MRSSYSILPSLSARDNGRVVVNASRSVSVPASFDTGLLLIKDANYTAAKRLKTYNSAAEAAAKASPSRLRLK